MNSNSDEELLRFLKASGIEMTDEQRAQVLQFNRRAEEAQDLEDRFWPAFPLRRNEGTLKRRHESGDRNVHCYLKEDGTLDHYELAFTGEQKRALLDAYKLARPNYDERIGVEARVFVGVLESWGDSIQLFSERKPEPQKDRTRSMQKINIGLMKIDEALAELDSGALGYWYAHIADATARSGYQLSESDSSIVSMVNEPLRAIVESGEFRQTLRQLVTAWVEATTQASETLPKFDHHEHDDRLTRAKALERLVIEHQIPFETSETGFPAQCLRAVFDLGGLEVEKVSYWLKKVADDPDSFARFLDRMRGKIEGENLPPV